MNLINSTTYNGKTYDGSDIKGIYPLKEFEIGRASCRERV